MKKCSKCGVYKDESEFHKDKYKKDGCQYECKGCRKEYYEKNKDKISKNKKEYNSRPEVKKYNKEYNKGKYDERRKLIIKHYSKGKNCCKKCGYRDIRGLAIDHIDNNGAEHRKEVSGGYFYKWLIKNNFPKGFQILCHNCNKIKEVCRLLEETHIVNDKKYILKDESIK